MTSASGALADQVAEHTVALITAWCRSLPTFFRAQQKKEFIRRPDPRPDPQHGGASWVSAAWDGDWPGCWRPSRPASWPPTAIPSTSPIGVEALWPAERLDELLPQVDILVLCVPLNPSTRAMIDAREAGETEDLAGCWSTLPGGRWSSRPTWLMPSTAVTWPAP